MNDFSLILALRLIHIVSGVFWVGSIIFMAWLLTPALRATGAAGGAVIQQLVRAQRLPAYLIAAMLLTVISGLLLFQHDSASFPGWMRTGTGMTFGAGAVLAIVGAIIGVFFNTPIAKRLSALGASIQAGGRPPTAEQAASLEMLQSRLARLSSIAAVLLILAVAAMAVARYIP
ncbi:MAG TPA: hypothetical protein VN717_02545 [Gemmatimonadaceae bacterium]|nr:hypothetical protein [Gemmatimonadaceae bacterium]